MSSTGFAAVFVGPRRHFSLRELPLPQIEPDAALIKVTTANVCGSDLHVWNGRSLIPNADPDGYIIGHEFTGRVFSLGVRLRADSLGRRLHEGDRVSLSYFYPCGWCIQCNAGRHGACPSRFTRFGRRTVSAPPYFTGAFAEYYYLRPGGHVFKVPDGLSNAVAAAANCIAAEAVFGLRASPRRTADFTLIFGAGGLGLVVCARVRDTVGGHIVVADRRTERLSLALEFGADATIAVDVTTPLDEARQEFLHALGGNPDLVVEATGVPETIPYAIEAARPGADILLLGCITEASVPIDPSKIVRQNLTLTGCNTYNPQILGDVLEWLQDAERRFGLHRLGEASLPLSRIDDAFPKAQTDLPGSHPVRIALIP